MAENKPKVKDKPETLFLPPDLTNYLFTAMTAIEEIDSNNRYAQLASQLKQTIMRYAKKERRKGDDRAAIILYGKEASALIMLLTIYISAISDDDFVPHDFFSELGKNKRGEPT